MITPTQKYLKSLRACEPARTWVGDRDLQTAWNECEDLGWMLWLVVHVARAKYNRVDIASWYAYERLYGLERDRAPALSEYYRVTTQARAEYDGVIRASRRCATCAEVRATFECPAVPKE